MYTRWVVLTIFLLNHALRHLASCRMRRCLLVYDTEGALVGWSRMWRHRNGGSGSGIGAA